MFYVVYHTESDSFIHCDDWHPDSAVFSYDDLNIKIIVLDEFDLDALIYYDTAIVWRGIDLYREKLYTYLSELDFKYIIFVPCIGGNVINPSDKLNLCFDFTTSFKLKEYA